MLGRKPIEVTRKYMHIDEMLTVDLGFRVYLVPFQKVIFLFKELCFYSTGVMSNRQTDWCPGTIELLGFSCAISDFMLDSWCILPHQVPHPPTTLPSYPASLIRPSCSSDLVDIQPLHHPLQGSSPQVSPGHSQSFSTGVCSVLTV